MRHLTWAMTWIVVGLAITLGTASVLSQVAMRQPQPAAPPIVDPAPTITPKPEQGRSVVVASRRHRDSD